MNFIKELLATNFSPQVGRNIAPIGTQWVEKRVNMQGILLIQGKKHGILPFSG